MMDANTDSFSRKKTMFAILLYLLLEAGSIDIGSQIAKKFLLFYKL